LAHLGATFGIIRNSPLASSISLSEANVFSSVAGTVWVEFRMGNPYYEFIPFCETAAKFRRSKDSPGSPSKLRKMSKSKAVQGLPC
jgi:hypothetical protein